MLEKLENGWYWGAITYRIATHIPFKIFKRKPKEGRELVIANFKKQIRSNYWKKHTNW